MLARCSGLPQGSRCKNHFRGKRLNERIQKLIETAKNKIKWSEEAIICVQGTLDPNVEITIGGKNIAVHKAMKDVMVTAVRFRDQFVNPLPYLDQFRKMIVDRAS